MYYSYCFWFCFVLCLLTSLWGSWGAPAPQVSYFSEIRRLPRACCPCGDGRTRGQTYLHKHISGHFPPSCSLISHWPDQVTRPSHVNEARKYTPPPMAGNASHTKECGYRMGWKIGNNNAICHSDHINLRNPNESSFLITGLLRDYMDDSTQSLHFKRRKLKPREESNLTRICSPAMRPQTLWPSG